MHPWRPGKRSVIDTGGHGPPLNWWLPPRTYSGEVTYHLIFKAFLLVLRRKHYGSSRPNSPTGGGPHAVSLLEKKRTDPREKS